MSVRLSIFGELAVLRVRRAIGARQVHVLVAGIRRVFETGVKTVLVDARGAELDDSAIAATRATTPALCRNEQGIRIMIVSPDDRFGEFTELAAALDSLEFSEKKELAAWFAAEDELDLLTGRKVELERQLGGGGEEVRKHIHKARGERVRAARLRGALSSALSTWNKRLSYWRKAT